MEKEKQKTGKELVALFEDAVEEKLVMFGNHPDAEQAEKEYAVTKRNLLNYIQKLEHHKDTTVGLWATDNFQVVDISLEEDNFFQIEDPFKCSDER